MFRLYFLLLAGLLFAFCQTEQQPQPTQVPGLQKVYYKNQEELQKLRDAGAQIIVQEPDYVVIKTENMTSALTLESKPIQESDLIQRLVKIYVKDATDLQTVVNSGIDLWEVKHDTAIARAYDIYIENLRQAGLSVEIIAADASKRKEK